MHWKLKQKSQLIGMQMNLKLIFMDSCVQKMFLVVLIELNQFIERTHDSLMHNSNYSAWELQILDRDLFNKAAMHSFIHAFCFISFCMGLMQKSIQIERRKYKMSGTPTLRLRLSICVLCEWEHQPGLCDPAGH